MNLQIEQVVDHGTQTSERVIIKVTGNCNIGMYLLADSTYTSNNLISDKLRHFYWLPDQVVKAGDKIIVYTKIGNASSKAIAGGNTEYNFYWGLNSCVWNNTGDAAVLFEIKDWTHFKARI